MAFELIKTIGLNRIQFATFEFLISIADNKNMLDGNMIRSSFNMNVIKALLRRNVLEVIKDNYRIGRIETFLYEPRHKSTSKAGRKYALALAIQQLEDLTQNNMTVLH